MPKASRAVRRAIAERKAYGLVRDRLMGFVDRELGSRRELERRADLAHSMVVKWFHPKRPSIPDMLSCWKIASATHVSLDWLFFGEGPELRGSRMSRSDFATDLRENLVSELLARGLPRRAVEALPDGEALRQRFIETYAQLLDDFDLVQPRRRFADTIRRVNSDWVRSTGAEWSMARERTKLPHKSDDRARRPRRRRNGRE